MPRPVWNGLISFGLLNIPVSLMSAEKRVDLHFRMIDSRTNQPIRYERVNAETGEEVPWKDIVQAFEYEKGNYVVLSKEEIAKAAPEGKETIEIDAFVERDAIQTVYFEKPYYLLPGKKAEKGYVLLRELLREKGRVGIGHVIIRTRRYLCAVMPLGDMLVLNLLRFHQEVVPIESFDLPPQDLEKYRINSRELAMAGQLVDSMTVDWEPVGYIDDYRERLSDIVEKRIASKQGLVHESPDHEEKFDHAATNVVDFMSLLQESLKSGRRSASSTEKESPTKKKAAKRSASKSTVANSAASKESAKKSQQKSPAAKTTSKRKAASKARGSRG